MSQVGRHKLLLPVRIGLMEIPSTISSQQQSDVLSCWASPNERFSHHNSNDPIVVAECGETAPSRVAQQFCLMSRISKPRLKLCRQTRTEQQPGAWHSSIAYKYNLLIILKIRSYTLYRKQWGEHSARLGKIGEACLAELNWTDTTPNKSNSNRPWKKQNKKQNRRKQ